ncbi:histone h3.3 [Phtheirospermum japonicum]|uniref:Histone h3.3 n=1 Tax=Phtheirospermum japonicum TaxID=374723 RepID=A0A830CNV6_9LAMI|nr:histone h3.3 [Phtheirospermum japonicum]
MREIAQDFKTDIQFQSSLRRCRRRLRLTWSVYLRILISASFMPRELPLCPRIFS